MTNVAVLSEATCRGLTICATGENLAIQPASLCPADFAATLLEHKPQLLALLKLHFVIIRSAALNETVFFAPDEQTKAALVQAGAEPASIYTRDELRVLIAQHRRQPITAAELLRLHQAKWMFSGRFVE